MSVDQPAGLIVDNGSDTCKIGLTGDDAPRSIFPTVVGNSPDGSNSYVGNEAHAKRELLSLIYPIERGLVTSWDDMEKIWNHAFNNELHVLPEEHPMLLTEAPMNPAVNREKMTQIMFETFNCPAMCISVQAVLSLFASGRTSGIVLDSGGGVTNAVPIFRGHQVPTAICRLNLAGNDLTDYLVDLLDKQGSSVEPNIAREIKEKYGYIAMDFDKETKLTIPKKSYKLPDGQTISFAEECFRCPEALFKPSIVGLKDPGIPEMLLTAITKCDEDTRKHLFSNTVLSGGSSMFAGLADRLKTELAAISPSEAKIKIIARPERWNSAWNGGAIMAKLSTFKDLCISKQEYEEFGAGVIHRRCP